MSYYPPGTGSNQPGPRPGPAYNPNGPAYSPGAPPTRRRSGGGLLGCGTFILGFLTAAVIAGIAVFFLYFYNPNGNQPLPRPTNPSGTPDITATLSQQYLNNEISRSFAGKPFKAGSVDLKDVVITVKADSLIDVAMRATYGGVANFDLTITEQVIIQNGQIRLTIAGQPKLTNGQLPPGVDAILQQINTQAIEPKINTLVNQITVNGRTLKLTGISSTPGLLTVQSNLQ